MTRFLLPAAMACALLGPAMAQTPRTDRAGSASTRTLGTEGAPTLEDYLPAGQAYSQSFPRPASVLGWPVGTWHVRHDQLVRWFEVVAALSPRVELMEYGLTHEGRPLLLAAISSPDNIERLEELRQAHVEAVRGGAESSSGPNVVWMGYGVHGNESSASNASILLAYHLAAAEGESMDEYLEHNVVLIDPCVNPDGGARFAHWANMHKGRHLTSATSHRDHSEAWPGGRTNHYWFDLNRDWLLLTHPESRGRVAMFQRWLPTVLTDYHEMGSSSTYFFQPGIPSRRNPMTPVRNHELTAAIARYHADALDRLGSQYFTEERFDDFYYGKGSTYPDIHGSIGILFEQASSRGHLVETPHGEMSFPFTIRNQFTTSLSTLAAADELSDTLGAYQRGFYRDAVNEGAEAPGAGWLFGGSDVEASRVEALADILTLHGIEIRIARAAGGTDSRGRLPYFIPAAQPQYRLLRSLFEDRTSWDDNTFYDVSAWSLAHSFDLDVSEVPRGDLDALNLGDRRPGGSPMSRGGGALTSLPADAVGALVAWDSLSTPPALASVLEAGVRVRVTTEQISGALDGQETPAHDAALTFPAGSLLVPFTGQELSRDELGEALAPLLTGSRPSTWLKSGLLSGHPDMGSGSYPLLRAPRVLLAVGSGVSAYEAGEVWHDIDTRMGLGVTLTERDRIASMDLEPFTHLVLVNGATTDWGEREERSLRKWVSAGGVLVATKRSSLWAAKHLMGHVHGDTVKEDEDHEEKPQAPSRRAYGDHEADRAATRIAGTIFRAEVDTTHPIAYGLKDTLPVFRNYEELLPEGEDPYAAPLRYSGDPLVSGFASPENVRRIAGTPAIRVERLGSGTVVAMVDNPCFRGVWYGTRRLLVNAVFFGHTVRRTGPIEERNEDEAMDYDHGHAHDR